MSKKNKVAAKNLENVVLNVALEGKHYYDTDALESIKSKKLANAVKQYSATVAGAKKNMWKMAYLLEGIVSGETYKEDFATDKQFAEFMEISPAALSKAVRVARLKVKNIPLEELGYGRAVSEEMLPLEKGGLLEKFFDSKDRPDPHMNRDDMRASVKAFMNMQNDERAEGKEQSDQNAEEGVQAEQSDADSLENYNDIDSDEYVYTVPIFNGDAVEEWTIKLTGYDAMERFAKAIRKAYDVEEKKGTVEELA